MIIHFMAGGVAYFCSVVVLMGATADDTIKAFETAVKSTPAAKIDQVQGFGFQGREITVKDLETALQRAPSEGNLENIIQRLMATHPSVAVDQAGHNAILALEDRRTNRAHELEVKATATLAKVSNAVIHAKTAADLDESLQQLRALQNSPNRFSESGGSIVNQIAPTFQFVTQWQDYLSASSSKNWQQAQNSLRVILSNQQIDAPTFFPRSEILARFEEAFHGGAKLSSKTDEPIVTNPDPILDKIRKPEDLDTFMPQLLSVQPIPGSAPWDWSGLIALSKARARAIAGLDFSLNLRQTMNGSTWGPEISRVTALVLSDLIPRYLETDVSAPIKKDESLSFYLERLSNQANADGNLALLQRALAVRVALGTPVNGTAPGTQQFLAGLSQEVGGQFGPAVVSYQNALKSPDHFSSPQVIGQRLAVIKAAHPEDFARGMTDFANLPASNNNDSRPPGIPPYPQYGKYGQFIPPGQFGLGNRPIYVLAIPDSISSPGKPVAPASGTAPSPSDPHK